MSNPPNRPPPPQQKAPPQQQKAPPPSQQRERTQERTRERPAPNQRPAQRPEIKAEEEVQSGVKTEEQIVVAGAGGAKNLATQWVDVWLPGGKPMYIIVTTLPGNDLDVMIEQRSWKKTYSAKGRVQTDVVPLAPIGTQGQLIAKDTTTGEELTVKFHWGPLKGPSLFARLVKLVKSLFVSSKT
ncbi:MAG TPA: hypothetical protein VMJ74_09515 [Pseudomonadales bacterium]|nr:hypothetical protein [Pseudomonadales bacterium]